MKNVTQEAIEITRAAGAVLMGFWQDRDSLQVSGKDGETASKNPVTDADYASDALLNERLLALLPEAGWLSEETADSPARLDKKYVWVVDPLDGTREFVMGIPEFTVSVALVKDGEPILGIIYNPATDEMFVGEKGVGMTLNGEPAKVTGQATLAGAVVDASRSERKRGEFEPFEAMCEIRTMGSVAYKLARVAAGIADATWSRGPKYEWDICAGVAMIDAAGGVSRDLSNAPMVFNKSFPKVPGIIADNGTLHDEIVGHIEQLGAARVGDQRA